jgi:MYXO-CTERM domain-containing protein
VIYTPGATASDPGSWALGPNMLYKTGPNNGTAGNDAEDEYTVTEPNGKVMIATYPFGGSPDTLQEYDPTTNTMASITPPPDPSPYPVSYLNLPNGQVMVTCGNRDYLYTPDSAPQDSWRPAVTSVTYNSGTTYTLTGTQLSGLINGGDEGDDMTMAENYPIVWLKDGSGNVYYCKSFNFSTMMPQAGSAPQTCQFTTPAGLPSGTYSLYVSSVGVQSKNPFSFTTGTSSSSSSSAATTSSGASGMTSSAASGGGSSTASTSGTGASGSGANGSGSGSGGPGATGSTGSGPAAGSSEGSSNGFATSPSGCGCRMGGRAPAGTAGGLAGLAGLVFVARRRRRSAA